MAKRTIVFDDLDGETPDAATVNFGLDGIAYEIDLAEDNAKRLRDQLAEFVAAARKVGRLQVGAGVIKASKPSRPAAAPAKPSGGSDNEAIREWAKGKGIEVKDRGRIPTSVVKQFEEALGGPVTGFAGLAPQFAAETAPDEAPKKKVVPATKSTGTARGRKSAAPPDDELLDALKQTGYNLTATAEHFANELGVSVATAKGWIKKAQDTKDPVT